MVKTSFGKQIFILSLVLGVAFASQAGYAKDIPAKWLANAFGYTKNAALVQRSGKEEDMNGHRNWALEQTDVNIVRKEILNQISRLEDGLKGTDTTYPIVFANLKNARLWLTTGKEEPLSGHIKWAQGVPKKTLYQGVYEEIAAIKKALK